MNTPLTRRHLVALLSGAAWSGLSACGGASEDPVVVLRTDTTGLDGWTHGSADHEALWPGQAFIFEMQDLPASLGGGRGLSFGSNFNVTDDIFNFIARRIDGLEPGAAYAVDIRLRLLVGLSGACAGVGGSPAGAVHVKAGVTGFEPLTWRDATGVYRVNFDKGNQGQSGRHALTVGDLSNTQAECSFPGRAELKDLQTATPIAVTADAQGGVWLIAGIDSGFEAGMATTLVRATLQLHPR